MTGESETKGLFFNSSAQEVGLVYPPTERPGEGGSSLPQSFKTGVPLECVVFPWYAIKGSSRYTCSIYLYVQKIQKNKSIVHQKM